MFFMNLRKEMAIQTQKAYRITKVRTKGKFSAACVIKMKYMKQSTFEKLQERNPMLKVKKKIHQNSS